MLLTRDVRLLLRRALVALLVAPVAFAVLVPSPAQAGGKGNLIKNGSAEKTTGTPTDFAAVELKHWKQKNFFTAARYAAALPDPDVYGSRLAKNSRGPGGRGRNYFTGTYHTSSADKGKATQIVNLKKQRRKIKRGAKAKLSAWLGGFASNEDKMKVVVVWLNARGKKVGKRMSLKPVTRLDRDPTPPTDGEEYTMLERRTSTAKVPRKAQRAKVMLIAKRGESGVRAAYADKLSLKINRR